MRTLMTDVAIVGAGTAGLAALDAVRRAGASALLIEQGPHGTTCARVGCMPSKLLIAAAEAAQAARAGSRFGVHAEDLRIDGAAVMARVRSERDRYVAAVIDDVSRLPAEIRLEGHARFLAAQVLQVGDHTRVQARSIILATGARPVVPADWRSLGDRLTLNDDVFEWTGLPQRVLVVGAGIIGLELGQALARLGVKITLLNRGDRLAGLGDPMATDRLRKSLSSELTLLEHARLDAVQRLDRGLLARWQEQDGRVAEGEFCHLLATVGRRPDWSGLDLHLAGIPLDAHDAPVIDAQTLRAGESAVFVAGDANGLRPLQHEAADDGRLAAAQALALPQGTPVSRRAPLAIVFTDPQVAMVGLRYREAVQRDDTCFGSIDFGRQGRARVMGRNHGWLRVYARRSDGRFLGAEMAAPSAEHLGHLLAWSLQQKLTLDQMLAMPFYHPVLEEGVRTALRRAWQAQRAGERGDIA